MQNSVLLLALQQYKDKAAATAASMEEEDQLLLLASQQYENENFATIEPPETSTSARIRAPVTDESIDQLMKLLAGLLMFGRSGLSSLSLMLCRMRRRMS